MLKNSKKPSALRSIIAPALLVGLTGVAGFGCGADMGYDSAYNGYSEAPAANPENNERYNDFGENEFIETGEEDTSSFSVDVNTASYTIARRDLVSGQLPNPDGVRTEEFINFFRFDYPNPTEDPFSINMEVAPSHFGSDDEVDRHLLRIGIRGKEVSLEEMKHNNLVFLIDTSGSMSGGEKLELVQESLHVLIDHLRPSDTVAVNTYAGSSETLLAPTPVSNRSAIENVIDGLSSGGSTYGEGGIVDSYNLAEEAFVEGGNNRVIILTDGDFNVGKTGDDLVDLVKSYHEREISLTSVGYGRGNYNDATMERLAREGSGNYFYVDTITEAGRIFGTDLPSTLEVIAQDARIQVEFNSDAVERYRLVGYEKRVMDNEEFDDETTDAAEIGPGHTVTAFYELELGADIDAESLLAEVRVRHREQYGEDTRLQSNLIKLSQAHDTFEEATDGFRFAAAVAEFAGVLRGSQYVQGARFGEIHEVADGARDEDYAAQAEFLELVDIAEGLWQD